MQYVPCAKVFGGSGEKRVRDVFPDWVSYIKRYQAQNPSSKRWLLVHIDADTLTVNERLRQLTIPLESTPITAKDSVCIVVPKRNTETWVYHLVNDGAEVSEEVDYKMKVTDDQVRDAGRRMANLPQVEADTCPPSLRRSLAELERIPR